MAYEKISFCAPDWDFSAPLILTVTPSRPWRQVDLGSKQVKIPHTCNGDGTITVTLTAPAKFSPEPDGDRYHNLFVFVGLLFAKP